MAKKKATEQRKIYVLDTSVILFDHNAVKSFQENRDGHAEAFYLPERGRKR